MVHQVGNPARMEGTVMKIPSLAANLACVALLAGCAYPGMGSRDYHAAQTRGEQSVRFGVVESIRDVRIDPYNTGVGAFTGAALGGIAGSTVGGGSGQAAGAIAGAVLGGILGANVEKSANERPGVEITVLLDSGHYIAIVQEADEAFRAGDRVRVLSAAGGRTTRVSH
jgi:outer membrane lipoprotein SlyB